MLRGVLGSLLVLATALTGSLTLAVSGAEAATRPTLTASPTPPMVGESVTARTQFATRVVRPVRLQRLSGTRWITVTRGSSTRRGAVALAYRATATRTVLRVLAPATRIHGRRYATRVSGVAAVRGTPQTVGVVFARDAGARVDARVTVSHARSGRVVEVLAQQADATWKVVATRRLGTSRTFLIDDAVPAASVAGKRLRVWTAAYRGAAATASSMLLPPTVGVPAVDGDPAQLTVGTTGTVRSVRFYLDGKLLGEDTAAPWGLSADPAAGTHDVVARAIGPVESVISPVTAFERATSPLGADSGIAENFAIDTVQSGLELPTSAGSTPEGIVFVAEKGGRVKVVEPNDDGWSVPHTVLDLSDDVLDEGDSGLTGLAVDPDFAANGYVYVSYVREGGVDRHAQQVVRFTWDGTDLAEASRHVVLGSVTGPECWEDAAIRTPDCVPLIGLSHTIGDLGFDDDGRLLVGIGDGALYLAEGGLQGRLETWRAQDPDVLAGKVLRIDPVTGRGVPDNPLYDGDGSSNASRVLALGLRNPFRFTMHGDQLVIGDVGEGDWEEINVRHLDESDAPDEPANFGWPCLEGENDTDLGDVTDPDSPWVACGAVRGEDGASAPSYSYPHNGNGGSISGGVFLDSTAYPASMRGRYVFGDYAQAFIRTADVDHDGEATGVAGLADATAAEGPVKFFTGPDGLVWSVSITTGSLRRIRWTGEALADRCEVGTFRRTFHDLDGPDSAFDQEYEGEYAWLFPYAAVQVPSAAIADPTCEPTVHLPETGGTRFATSWRGRVDVDAGTWRFQVDGTEWIRLWVDNQPVHDFYANAFWGDNRVHDVALAKGQHLIQVEHLHGDQDVAAADVTWTRVGGPPTVALTAPANGYVPTGGAVPWSVEVSDPDGDDPAALASTVVLAVDSLHYTGTSFHAHPSSRITGQTSGTVQIDDVHAPGSVVIRLKATVTDASGARTTSAPVYICLPGTTAGPCAG
ncbi:PQQ-dependent sugar dehydrogenase [Nocardioides sp. WS12]|uniref:PQQ-dependent sugar dehydrogenase n=1 Tax=Nocardioides sp. WS12 TaxID=2486272 RepID=UPI0015F870B2|nr:PQQ-dependent sugar dehydrogenase [Nocardioides sp. WS12]